MDKIETEKILRKNAKNIEFHSDFLPEYFNLVEKTGKEKQIANVFARRLFAMQRLDCDFGPKWLERLKHCDNMYSLHIDVEKLNYRVLFSKSNDNKIFLHMFYEQSGKKDKSYANHLPIAEKRMEEYLKGDKRQ